MEEEREQARSSTLPRSGRRDPSPSPPARSKEEDELKRKALAALANSAFGVRQGETLEGVAGNGPEGNPPAQVVRARGPLPKPPWAGVLSPTVEKLFEGW